MVSREASSADTITWEDSFAIARALILEHPDIQLDDVSLGMIYKWTIELPGFTDDKGLANDSILAAIYQEWFEEINRL